MGHDIELVVARHRERIEWCRNVPRAVRVTILDRGQDLETAACPGARLLRLPGAGRATGRETGHEAYSYLSHIVARRGELAELTVFCQGHPFDHAHDLHAVLRGLAAARRDDLPDFRWLGFIVDTDDARGRRLFVPWSKNHDRRELQLDRFHRELFGAPAPAQVEFFPGAQFAVRRSRVLARPAAFYARALELATSFPDAGHCFERLWDRVFGLRGVDPGLLALGPTRYLKPIRRLGATSPSRTGSPARH